MYKPGSDEIHFSTWQLLLHFRKLERDNGVNPRDGAVNAPLYDDYRRRTIFQRIVIEAREKIDWQTSHKFTSRQELHLAILDELFGQQKANITKLSRDGLDKAIGERDNYKNDLDNWAAKFNTDNADTAKTNYDKAVNDLAKEKGDHNGTRKELAQSNEEKVTAKEKLEN